MNYELAKKLQENGYKGYLHFESDGTVTCSLTELIEACGLGFNRLFPLEGMGSDEVPKWQIVGWLAEASRIKASCQCCLFKGQGHTPEEAVANLWLELNKKPED